jgi:membrane dipeptidase
MPNWNVSPEAEKLHRAALVWDGHSCLPLRSGVDMTMLRRHRDAGIDYVSVNVGMDFNPVEQVMRVIAGFRAGIAANPGAFVLAATAADVRRAKAEGKLAVTFDLEGSDMLAGDVNMLSLYWDLGVRQIHLAYNRNNAVGGGCHDADTSLTAFGRKVVAEINRLGMLMDCSHTGYRTSLDILELSRRPVIFSHACVHALKPHGRNVRDDQIDACARTGGVIGVTGIGIFLGDNDNSTETMVRHIDYIAERVGPRHAGVALDFVFERGGDEYPKGFDRKLWWPPGNEYDTPNRRNVAPEQMPALTEALMKRGYAEADIRGILGENFLRVAAQSWGG